MTRTALWVTLMPAVVLWLSGCSSGPATAPLTVAKDNRAEIVVTERGFEPAQVLVTHGRPVTLVVTRMTEMTCVTEMVMPSHGIRRMLPLRQPVEITFPCDSVGTMPFSCGMGMMSGAVMAR